VTIFSELHARREAPATNTEWCAVTRPLQIDAIQLNGTKVPFTTRVGTSTKLGARVGRVFGAWKTMTKLIPMTERSVGHRLADLQFGVSV
jgi:hypothetical protein